jgi:MATE family multidrug resistance protein
MVKSSSWIEEIIALIKLSFPIIVTQLGQIAILTTDIIMLGAYSKETLAGVSLGMSIYISLSMLGTGPPTIISTLITHSIGRNRANYLQPRLIVRMSLWIVLAMSIPLIFLCYKSELFFIFLCEPRDISYNAGLFTKTISLGLPFALGFQALRSYCVALEKPIFALISTFLTIFINIILDYALIFGHFGLPEMGIVGAGLASAFSIIFSFSFLLIFIRIIPSLWLVKPFKDFFIFDRVQFLTILKLGMPIGFTNLFEVTFFSCSALIAGHFGSSTIAANQIVLNIATITFMIPYGIGLASSVRIGLAVGAFDYRQIKLTAIMSYVLSISIMSFIAMLLWVFSDFVVNIYIGKDIVDRMSIIHYSIQFVQIAAIFQLFDAIQVIAIQGLRGLKDTKIPMFIAGASYWFVGFPLSLFLSFYLSFHGLGIWLSFCICLFLSALLLSIRFFKIVNRLT